MTEKPFLEEITDIERDLTNLCVELNRLSDAFEITGNTHMGDELSTMSRTALLCRKRLTTAVKSDIDRRYKKESQS